MQFLYDSRGHHAATVVNRQLYNTDGPTVGQYLPQYGVFVDMRGRYLGELVSTDRLLVRRASPFLATIFPTGKTYRRRIGSVGDPGRREPLGPLREYEDVDPIRLQGYRTPGKAFGPPVRREVAPWCRWYLSCDCGGSRCHVAGVGQVGGRSE